MADSVNNRVPIPLNVDPQLRVCLQKLAHVDGDLDANKADKVTGATADNLAKFDSDGDLADAGVAVDDTGTDTTAVWTADKITEQVMSLRAQVWMGE